MPAVNDGGERRPGCVAGRLLAVLARLALVYPLVSIGLQLGEEVQRRLWPQIGTPYEGAFVGIIIGGLIGLSLWRRALGGDGWRAGLADATLATVALLWLGAIVLGARTPLPASELTVPWTACLVGSGGIALLLRA
ncbi:MAG: hypothetical protein ACOCX2_06920 [Armatimonadota bacterium]